MVIYDEHGGDAIASVHIRDPFIGEHLGDTPVAETQAPVVRHDPLPVPGQGVDWGWVSERDAVGVSHSDLALQPLCFFFIKERPQPEEELALAEVGHDDRPLNAPQRRWSQDPADVVH